MLSMILNFTVCYDLACDAILNSGIHGIITRSGGSACMANCIHVAMQQSSTGQSWSIIILLSRRGLAGGNHCHCWNMMPMHEIQLYNGRIVCRNK